MGRFHLRIYGVPYWLIVFVFVLSCQRSESEATPRVDLQFTNADSSKSEVITAEIRNTPQGRSLGFMYRKELLRTSGMLFIFPEEKPRSFWMKNTYLELDIIFVRSDGIVDSIQARAKPLTIRPRKSAGAAKYVVEVRGGMAAGWGVQAGSKLVISGEIPEGE